LQGARPYSAAALINIFFFLPSLGHAGREGCKVRSNDVRQNPFFSVSALENLLKVFALGKALGTRDLLRPARSSLRPELALDLFIDKIFYVLFDEHGVRLEVLGNAFLNSGLFSNHSPSEALIHLGRRERPEDLLSFAFLVIPLVLLL